jgi:hypothetical protein
MNALKYVTVPRVFGTIRLLIDAGYFFSKTIIDKLLPDSLPSVGEELSNSCRSVGEVFGDTLLFVAQQYFSG